MQIKKQPKLQHFFDLRNNSIRITVRHKISKSENLELSHCKLLNLYLISLKILDSAVCSFNLKSKRMYFSVGIYSLTTLSYSKNVIPGHTEQEVSRMDCKLLARDISALSRINIHIVKLTNYISKNNYSGMSK